MKRKLFVAIFLTVVVMNSFIFSTNAATIENLIDMGLPTEVLAEKYLGTNSYLRSDGSEVEEYYHINKFENKIRASKNYTSEMELAKEMYRYLGTDEESIEKMPDEHLIEVFNYSSSTTVTSYIRQSEDGVSTYMSKEEVAQELSNVSNLTSAGRAIVLPPIEDSGGTDDHFYFTNDGYMSLVTTTNLEIDSQEDRCYYVVSAEATWLNSPTWTFQDVLAISTTAVYDDTYNNYGYFNEVIYSWNDETNTRDVEAEYERTVYKNSTPQDPDKIALEYSTGGSGIALRFDLESTVDSVLFGYDLDIVAGVRFRCFLNQGTDGIVQTAYAHQTVNFGKEISVDVTSGAVGFSIGLGDMTEYYAEPVTIYYM